LYNQLIVAALVDSTGAFVCLKILVCETTYYMSCVEGC